MYRRNLLLRFIGEPDTRFNDFEREDGEFDEIEMGISQGSLTFVVPHEVPDDEVAAHMRHLHGEMLLDDGSRLCLVVADAQNDVVLDVETPAGNQRSNTRSRANQAAAAAKQSGSAV